MLANRYIPISDASKWSDHVCTGWFAFDAERRMACSVGDAVQQLEQDGITRGTLAVTELGSKVEMRSELRGQSDLGAGHVEGIRSGRLVVQWSGRGEKSDVVHHLVRLTVGR